MIDPSTRYLAMPTKEIPANASFSAPDKLADVLKTCRTEFGKDVESANEITSRPSAEKTVLLLRFAGGLKVKLCVSVVPGYRFDAAADFAHLIGEVRFPNVLLRGDGWAAFEWIEGNPVTELGVNHQIVGAAVGILKSIHEAKCEINPETGLVRLREVKSIIANRMPALVSRGIVSGEESDRITALCDSLRPESFNVSLIHGDFSPENLVARGNELYVIDNEKMRVHVADYDVCRAVSFWDEWAQCGQSFLDRYQLQSRLKLDQTSLSFWSIFNLIYRISYRISACSELNNFCINQLKGILTTGTLL